jgi:hypothetical protein
MRGTATAKVIPATGKITTQQSGSGCKAMKDWKCRRTYEFHNIRLAQEWCWREIRACWQDHTLELRDRECEYCGDESERKLESVRCHSASWWKLLRGSGIIRTNIMVTIVKTMMVLDCTPEDMASLRLTRASSTYACCCLRFKRSLS